MWGRGPMDNERGARQREPEPAASVLHTTRRSLAHATVVALLHSYSRARTESNNKVKTSGARRAAAACDGSRGPAVGSARQASRAMVGRQCQVGSATAGRGGGAARLATATGPRGAGAARRRWAAEKGRGRREEGAIVLFR
ncbi:hypothetical protein SETIT_2G398200v2 [Setaria italica]|uniref:Uncharacterized protein n=1 Tax=Setaria italica TaxID=4555 RepID=A0A368Q814_SETIT|nr:hypothetical protein SETIT_2G398200v2 [Setaria italica]